MKRLKQITRVKPAIAVVAGVVSLTLAGCENTGGTGSPGIGTVAGAAAGAGAGRPLRQQHDRHADWCRRRRSRRQHDARPPGRGPASGEAAAAQDAAMQRQLDFERQRALRPTKSSGRSKNGGCSSNGSASAPRSKVKTDGRRLGATG